MKRVIIKSYDSTNCRWIVDYFRVWDFSVWHQRFSTPLFCNTYIGMKSKCSDVNYFGKNFIKILYDVIKQPMNPYIVLFYDDFVMFVCAEDVDEAMEQVM